MNPYKPLAILLILVSLASLSISVIPAISHGEAVTTAWFAALGVNGLVVSFGLLVPGMSTKQWFKWLCRFVATGLLIVTIYYGWNHLTL